MTRELAATISRGVQHPPCCFNGALNLDAVARDLALRLYCIQQPVQLLDVCRCLTHGEAQIPDARRDYRPHILLSKRRVEGIDADEYPAGTEVQLCHSLAEQIPSAVFLSIRHRVLQIEEDCIGVEHRRIQKHLRLAGWTEQHGTHPIHVQTSLHDAQPFSA